MSTSTLITVAPTGRTIAKAYTRGTDALATNGTATSLTYGSANVNLLTIVWTNLADGDYDFILTNAGGSISSDILRVSGVTAILLGDREYAELNSEALLAALGLEAGDLDTQLAEILAAAGGGGAGGLTGAQNTKLNQILAAVAQITGARLEVAGAVTPAGRIRVIRGKDYTAAGSSLIARSVADVGGVLAARLNAVGTTLQFGARLPGTPPQTIAGTIASVVYASDVTVISIEIPAANLPLTLSISDGYIYQIQRTTAGQKVPELSGALSLELDAV